MEVRIWLSIQFPNAPFTTEAEVSCRADTRRDVLTLIESELIRIRADAERIEMRCIFWEKP